MAIRYKEALAGWHPSVVSSAATASTAAVTSSYQHPQSGGKKKTKRSSALPLRIQRQPEEGTSGATASSQAGVAKYSVSPQPGATDTSAGAITAPGDGSCTWGGTEPSTMSSPGSERLIGTGTDPDEHALAPSPALAPSLPFHHCVIVDEAHGAVAKTPMALTDLYRAAGAVVVGLTATPTRLREDESLASVFETVLQGPSVSELVERGILVPPRVVQLRARSFREHAAIARKKGRTAARAAISSGADHSADPGAVHSEARAPISDAAL